jgi:streptogrisin C
MLKRLLVVLLVVFAVLATTASGGALGGKPASVSQAPVPGEPAPSPPEQPFDGRTVTVEEARLMNAREVARMLNTSVDDVLNRFDLQANEIPAFGDLVRAREKSRLGGFFIQQEPDFRVVVLLTSGGIADVEDYIPDRLRGLVEVRLVSRTHEQLRSMLERLGQLRSTVQFDAYTNVALNRIELQVVATTPSALAVKKETLRAVAAQSGFQLPEWVNVEGRPSLLTLHLDVFGGLALSNGCTTGVSIIDSQGTSGVTTAGHCDNFGSYAGNALTFRTERKAEHWDLQWYSRANTNFPAKILRGQGVFNPVTGKRARWNQDQGSWVCHHGISVDFSCGTLITHEAFPPPEITNGQPTFMLVNYTCAGGDSGGPVYEGGAPGVIWGTHVGGPQGGGQGSPCVYMAANYVENNTMNLYIKGT